MEPNPSRTLVLKKLRDCFPGDAEADEALILLNTYVHNERERVQLALLRLSGGDLARLRRLLEDARSDYRDTLSAAEYDRRGDQDAAYTAWLNSNDGRSDRERQIVLTRDVATPLAAPPARRRRVSMLRRLLNLLTVLSLLCASAIAAILLSYVWHPKVGWGRGRDSGLRVEPL